MYESLFKRERENKKSWNIMSKLKNVTGAIGSVTGALGGVLGVGSAISSLLGNDQERQNQRYMQNQRDLMEFQSNLNESAAQKAYGRQLDYFNQTAAYNSPLAEVNRLKAAGLNPSLMYGNGGSAGGSGATGSGGGMASTGLGSPQRRMNSAEIQSMRMNTMRQGLELGLLGAQKRNIDADTAVKEADATKTSGVDTQNTMADTMLKQMNTGNAGLDGELRMLQVEFDKTRNRMQSATEGYSVEKVQWEMERAYEDYRAAGEMALRLERENQIGEQTKRSTIEAMNFQMVMLMAELGEKRARAYEATQQGDWTGKQADVHNNWLWFECAKVDSNVKLTEWVTMSAEERMRMLVKGMKSQALINGGMQILNSLVGGGLRKSEKKDDREYQREIDELSKVPPISKETVTREYWDRYGELTGGQTQTKTIVR